MFIFSVFLVSSDMVENVVATTSGWVQSWIVFTAEKKEITKQRYWGIISPEKFTGG